MRFPTTPMCDGELLAAFEPTTRPTDVFVATVAKSGQTWLLALLHHLRTGGFDPDFGGRGLLAATPWLEYPRDHNTNQPYDRAARLRELAAYADPRVFKLHVLYEEVPRAAGSGAKLMTITRDPRDLPWSLYAHLSGMRPEVVGSQTAGQSFDAFFESWMTNGWFWKVVRSFWPHRDDPDLLWLRYEDLKADLPREARKCVAFLGWDVDEDGVARACALSDFGMMSAKDKVLGFDAAFQDGHKFVREGAIGKNRARLSPEQEARIVTRAREELDPECFAFVMAQGA